VRRSRFTGIKKKDFNHTTIETSSTHLRRRGRLCSGGEILWLKGLADDSTHLLGEAFEQTTSESCGFMWMCCSLIICVIVFSINTYIHTYIPTYIPTYLPTYLHTYITLHYIALHYITLHYITYIHTYLHTYIHTYIHTHIHTYIHTLHYITLHCITLHYIHTYIHTYIIYVYIYYIYTLYTLYNMPYTTCEFGTESSTAHQFSV